MRYSSRKCACRRGFNSHDAAKPRIPTQRRRIHRSGRPKHRNQHPDFNQGRRERRPVQRHDDAARGGERMRQRASARLVSARMRGSRSQYKSGHQSTGREPRPITQCGGVRPKAQSAMQSRWLVPQTRSTATALAVALRRKQNPSYANAACGSAELMPNPSLEARPNIKLPGPRSGLAHSPPRGPGILLLVPPQLER